MVETKIWSPGWLTWSGGHGLPSEALGNDTRPAGRHKMAHHLGADRGIKTMRAIARRLQRLEERWRPAVESEATRQLRARLEAARLRCGSPPVSPARVLQLRGMTI